MSRGDFSPRPTARRYPPGCAPCVEEPIPGEGEPELRPQLLDGDGLQPAHRGALELFQGAEGPEIVGAAQILGGQAHGRHVQGLLDVVEVVPLKDVGQLAVPNAVDVGLTGAGEAGVEPGLHLLQGNGPMSAGR